MLPKTRHVAIGALVTLAAYIVWLFGGWPLGDTLTVIDDFVLSAFSLMAAVFSALAARASVGRMRKAWTAMAVGCGGWVVGELIWTYYEGVVHQNPFPSLADAAFLLFPVGACAALLLFPDDYSNLSLGRVFLDGLIVAGSLFVVSWVTVLGRLSEASDPDRLDFVVSLAYPVTDVVVLTVAAMMLIKAHTRHRTILALLTAGMAFIAVADSAYVYVGVVGKYVSGTTIDIGWATGFLLITVAAAAGRTQGPTGDDSDRLPGWASIWLPYAPLLLAALVAAAEPPRALSSGPILLIAILLVAAVMGRQFLAVTENRQLLEKLAVQARRDPLTGLANRTLLYERFEHAMRLRERDKVAVGVMSLDLNDFKLVNDTFGHHAGDELLVLVAARLAKSIRGTDTVARLGGDEFVILVEGEPDAVHVLADRVVAAFDEPFMVDGHELVILPSVGVATADSDEPDLSVDELLRRSDVAMYASKRSRSRGAQTYNPQMRAFQVDDDGPHRARARTSLISGANQLELLGQLRRAIARSELDLVYQPQIDLRTSQIVAAEALVRWNHHTRGPLRADEFLPLVRRYGLMGALNEFVVNRALDDTKLWHAESVGVPVGVNLFAPPLANLEFPDAVEQALADRGLGATALIVEITEHLLLDNLEPMQTVLDRLRRTGVRIALDDFGSGYSAVSQLRDLPIDQVKLDRDFIAPINQDQRSADLVHAVVDFAHALKLTIVAEGVEDAETEASLRSYGCDLAQGYFYSPPLACREFVDCLKASELTTSPPASG